MDDQVQYIVNKNGKKTSVVLPYKKWEKLNNDYLMLQNKLNVFSAIDEGMEEIKVANLNGKQLQTLSDFLKDGNS